MARLTLQVNGAARDVEIDDPATPLLYVLRNDLALTGTKFGCGLAQCGACTVHLDGQAIRSCAMPVSAAVGRQITTIEGLGSPERPDPVQAAFIAEQAPQCGYCTAGLVMAARAFLQQWQQRQQPQQNRQPTEPEIKRALAGNLCRCGSHVRVIRAVMRAATAMGGA
jgi:nicotinate dehydrogenase subunit A